MKALVIEPPGAIALRHVSLPGAADECLIRVRLAGICGTDLQLLEGYAGFHGIPGHEFVGVVARAPAFASYWTGKRVVGEINVGCGVCGLCAAGVKEHCRSRTVVGIRERDGAFAEYLTLPAENLHEIPEGMDDETAVFVEPVAAACRILEQVDVDGRMRVAVLGDGRMGVLIAQVLGSAARELIVLGRHQRKLAIARGLGLVAVRADELRPGAAGFDIVVDATGRPDGLQQSLALVRPRGTIVMKSTVHGESAIAASPIVVNEVTIVGSRCGPFRRAIDLLSSGAVLVKPLISCVAPLEQHESAFAEARRAMKVILKCSEA